MEDFKVTLENGVLTDVKGIFYIYNLKYYFIYTTGEKVDQDYIQLYMAQVFKEVKNTPEGTSETGYMLGIETANQEEWANVQGSVTKILDAKKTGIPNPEIQNLPSSMLYNLKIVSKNKFKLLKSTLKDTFGLEFEDKVETTEQPAMETQSITDISQILAQPQSTPQPVSEITPIPVAPQPVASESQAVAPLPTSVPASDLQQNEDVIIDYRAKFFEEQDKNQELEAKLKELEDKINSIKAIL